MNKYRIGFIGGGRITSIFLKIFTKSMVESEQIVISDINKNTLSNLKTIYPTINTTNENCVVATAEIVFISLHPPVIMDVLKSIKSSLNENTVLISLAPKISVKKISEVLDGFSRVVRVIPNSPSIISKGYNPIYFNDGVDENAKEKVLTLFKELGEYKIVEEKHLEAYAIISAMGPTYLQFQLKKLMELAEQFGLDRKEAKNTVFKMVDGINTLLCKSGLTYEEVSDLIPVKPMKDNEEEFLSVYDSKLKSLYEKLRS